MIGLCSDDPFLVSSRLTAFFNGLCVGLRINLNPVRVETPTIQLLTP